jgi:hypothetical protein
VTYSISDSATAIAAATAGARNEAVDITATTAATLSEAATIEAANNTGVNTYAIGDTASNLKLEIDKPGISLLLARATSITVLSGNLTTADINQLGVEFANGGVYQTVYAANGTDLLTGTTTQRDDTAPDLLDRDIFLLNQGATGTAGAYKTGDTITVVFDPSQITDAADLGSGVNPDATSAFLNSGDTVQVDFSEFGRTGNLAFYIAPTAGAAAALVAANTVNQGGLVNATYNGTTDKWTATYTLAEGSIDITDANVRVRAIDEAGNASTWVVDGANLTIDNQTPTVGAITSAVTNPGTAANILKLGSTLTVSAADANPDVAVASFNFTAFGGGVVNGTYDATTDKWSASYTITAGNLDTTGLVVPVTFTDDAGNISSVVNSSSYGLDNQADADNNYALQPGAAFALINAAEAAAGSITFSASGLDDEMAITAVTATDGVTTITGTATAPSLGLATATFAANTFSGLNDGPITVSAIAVDNAGNSKTVTSVVQLDKTAPAVTLNPLSGTYITNASTALSGRVDGVPGGTTVTATVGSTQLTTTTNGNGEFSLNLTSVQIAAATNAVVSVADPAGNPASATLTFDKAAPTAPSLVVIADDTGASSVDLVTNDQSVRVTLTGSEPNLTPVLKAGSTVLNIGQVTQTAGTGSDEGQQWLYSFDLFGNWGDDRTINAYLRDQAGNESPAASSSIRQDLNAPSGPGLLTINTISADSFINASEQTGVTISGAYYPAAFDGASARLQLSIASYDNNQVGSTLLTLTPTLNASAGTWSVNLSASDIVALKPASPAPPERSLTALLTGSDLAGNALQGAPEVRQQFNLDLAAPAAATFVGLRSGDDTSSGLRDTFSQNAPASGQDLEDEITSVARPQLRVNASVGAFAPNGSNGGTVALFHADANGVATGAVLASQSIFGGSGTNEVQLTPSADLTTGSYVLVTTDAAGNTSTSAAFPITIDPTDPNPPSAISVLAGSEQLLASGSGGTYSDGLTNNLRPVISGTAEANSFVKIEKQESGNNFYQSLGYATANGFGQFSFTPGSDITATGPNMQGSSNPINLRLTSYDLAGNSASTNVSYNLDTQAPSRPSATGLQNLTLNNSYTQGYAVGDANDGAFTVSGTAEAGSRVRGELYATTNGAPSGSALATFTAAAVTSGNSGTGSFSLSLDLDDLASSPATDYRFADGSYLLKLQATDAAGNDSTAFTSGGGNPQDQDVTLLIDRSVAAITFPTLPSINSFNGSGNVSGGLPISATFPEQGGSYSLRFSQGNANEVLRSGSINDTNFNQFISVAELTDNTGVTFQEGNITVALTYTDQAGNSTTASQNVLFDKTLLAPVFNNATTAALAGGFINATELSSFAFAGTVEAASSLTISLSRPSQGGGGGSTSIGSPLSTTAASDGAFSIGNLLPAGTTDGTINYILETRDPAGNRVVSNSSFILDTTADAGTPLSVLSDAVINNDRDDGPYTFKFAGLDSDVPYGNITATITDGTVGATPLPLTSTSAGLVIAPEALKTLKEGTLTITGSIRDLAGNTKSFTPHSVLYDRSVGQVQLNVADQTFVAINNAAAFTISGTAEAGSRLLIQATDSRRQLVSAERELDLNTTSFSVPLDLTGLREGELSLKVVQVDRNGNVSDPVQRTLRLDLTSPALATETISVTGGSGAGGSFRPGDTLTITATMAASADVASVTADLSALGLSATQALTAVSGQPGVYSAAVTLAAGAVDSLLTLPVRATDTAGNLIGRVSQQISVDLSAPTLAASAISLSGSRTGTTQRIGDTITASIAASAVAADVASGGLITANFSEFGGPAAVPLTLVGSTYSASYTLVEAGRESTSAKVAINLTDNANNAITVTSTASLGFDAQAPVLAVNRQVILPGQTGASLSGQRTSADGEVFSITIDGISQASSGTSLANNGWSLSLPANLTAGLHDITLTGTDNAGNVTIDATARELLVATGPLANEAVRISATPIAVASGEGANGQTLLGIATRAVGGAALPISLDYEQLLSNSSLNSLAATPGLSLASRNISFTATGTTNTDLGVVKFLFSLPEGEDVNTILKWDPAANGGLGGYREFTYDYVTGTGSRLEDLDDNGSFDALAIYVKDNGRGDTNPELGKVSDPGILATSRQRVGDAGDNDLQGTSQADVLDGGAGGDVLDGIGGADTLIGGTGDDIYIVTNGDTRIVESNASAGGTGDLLYTTVSQVLRSGVDDVILLGDAVNARGNALGNMIVGNALVNRLEGMGGDDMIYGQAGDTLLGGDGNDLLVNELVYGSASYSGNARATLTGDAGNDRLIGARGDLLSGGVGNDLLVGLDGGATLIGGAGNDGFVVAAYRNLGAQASAPYERNIVSDFVASGANADKLLLVGVTIPTGQTSSRAASVADLSFVQQYGGTELRVADQSVAFLKGVNATSLNSSMVDLRTALPELDSALMG